MKNNKLKITLFFLYLFTAWGIYRYLTFLPEIMDELIFKPLIWFYPVVFIVKKVEKKELKSLGLVFKKPLSKIFLGILLSLFILGEYLLALLLKGQKIVFNPQMIKGVNWISYSLMTVSTGFVEEVVFRGFFMTRIDEIINDKLFANVIAGGLFLIIHIPILIFDQGQGLTGVLEFFVLAGSLSLIDGFVFWWSKGILAPISAHISLNFLSLLIG